MFGIRTILIALDLVTGDEAERERALRRAPLIHAADRRAPRSPACAATSRRGRRG